jgi:hypothetical protein
MKVSRIILWYVFLKDEISNLFLSGHIIDDFSHLIELISIKCFEFVDTKI